MGGAYSQSSSATSGVHTSFGPTTFGGIAFAPEYAAPDASAGDSSGGGITNSIPLIAAVLGIVGFFLVWGKKL